MNTTVLTVDALDFGAGPHRKQTFPQCKWTVDQSGALHVIREGGRGTAMSFAHGSWRLATDGTSIVAAEVAR